MIYSIEWFTETNNFFINPNNISPVRYHVPRSWLKPTQNLLVLFEELGGDPSRISLVKRSVSSVCADVSEYHPTIKNWHIESYGKSEELHRPKVHLRCSQGQTISSIKFASFGTPLGTCGSYQQGTCHAATSYDILEKVQLQNSVILFYNTLEFRMHMLILIMFKSFIFTFHRSV
jgi:hypothetical protein